MVARHNDTVVDALIRRLERDGILRQALCIRNLLHQVNIALQYYWLALCSFIFSNSAPIYLSMYVCLQDLLV